MKGLDVILKDIEPDNFRISVLLKKYLELNGKIVCFDIDPKFNDALDGLLVLDLHNVPADTVKLLSKEFNNKYLLKGLNHGSVEVLSNYRNETVSQL